MMHCFNFLTCYYVNRNSFTGKLKAYGGGNDNNLNTVKAGPGTIYLLEGKAPKEVHSVIITGDADSPVQEQTKAYLSGNAGEFVYSMLTLSGMLIYHMSVHT